MKIKLITIALGLGCITALFSCKGNGLYEADYTNAGGIVLGKEICNANETDDYWLIDLSYYPNTPQYGDTLQLNSVTYNNVIKTKQLDPVLKHISMRVSLDFNTVTSQKIITTGCTVTNPETYPLKELFIINQGEIR